MYIGNKDKPYTTDAEHYRTREESAPPENELQKTLGDSLLKTSHVCDHGMRFRKSTEKLTVPNWYLENRATTRPSDVNAVVHRDTNIQSAQNFTRSSDVSQPPISCSANNRTISVASTGIDFPKGMFDRYKEEIEDMRRSKSSLHQIAKDQRQCIPDIV
ncbi:hypothetical protein NECAME_13536 [Necator americanus]|uniref:Uncharacterized protein n=1 Tax=Necator americanus TaxID=51031 RepID=W2SUT2_NECAM|nr:hypothetical protein NECAME_13536 [Necator americanus]ETN73390.1 hypothetical protein NECAME_13536 [Necator americanus]